MKTTAIYPGTFDPMTLGHVDLIRRSLNLFDHIIIAVSKHLEKKPLFSLEKRVEIIQSVFKEEKRVSVEGFDDLLINFAKEKNVSVILRGIRVVSDFDYEFQLASMNRQLAPSIETVFLTPAEKYAYLSSSLIREIINRKGDISPFVPKEVIEML